MNIKHVYVTVIDSRYGRTVRAYGNILEAEDGVYDWVAYNWDMSDALHEMPEDKKDAIASYFNFYEGESYRIYMAPVGNYTHVYKRIENTLAEAITHIRTHFEVFIQGIREADGDSGVSFSSDDRQSAYDMGRTLGKSEISRLEIGG